MVRLNEAQKNNAASGTTLANVDDGTSADTCSAPRIAQVSTG